MQRPCSNSGAPKQVQLLATVLSALACDRRIELVELLCNGELSEKEIVRTLQTTRAADLRHLHRLKQAGIVSVRRKANWRLCSLKHSHVCDILTSVHELLKEELGPETRTLG